MEMPLLVKQIGAIVSLIFLTITGILLIMDLGRPDRFLYVLFRPQWKSWLSRGSYIITIYGGILTLWLAASFFGFENILKYIEPFGIIFALLSAVYTAFLFAQAKGRDFWQSPMLGLHMIIHSLMAGFAVFLLVNLFLNVNVGFTLVLTFLSIVNNRRSPDNSGNRTDHNAFHRRRAQSRQNDYKRSIQLGILVGNDLRRKRPAARFIVHWKYFPFWFCWSFDLDRFGIRSTYLGESTAINSVELRL